MFLLVWAATLTSRVVSLILVSYEIWATSIVDWYSQSLYGGLSLFVQLLDRKIVLKTGGSNLLQLLKDLGYLNCLIERTPPGENPGKQIKMAAHCRYREVYRSVLNLF